MDSADADNRIGWLFLAVGLVVVVTLVTLPYVGRFFAAAVAGGAVIAGAMLWWHLRGPR